MPKINLALAGGGLKSYVQIAVLHKLEEENIKINAISGTSMGSCIAALKAIGCDAKTIEKEMLDLEDLFQENHMFLLPTRKHIPFVGEKIEGGYIDGSIIEEKLEEVFKKYGVYHISDVKIPLAIPSVDLKTGKLVVFVNDKDKYESVDEDHVVIDDISLAKAVRASSSIPFVFSSVLCEDYTLVDGGVKLNIPLPLLKGFSNHKSLAIITKKEIEELDSKSLIPLALQIYNINSNEFDLFVAKQADYHINFPLGRFLFAVGKGEEIIQRAKDHLDHEDIVIETIKKDKGLLSFLDQL